MILRTCRMARRGGSYTQIQYSPTGFKMQLMNGQTYAKAWVPMPAGTAEVWQASGSAIYYQHADWLGSERFESTTSRTMYNDLAYAPFGEPYAQSGSGDISFAGINQDTTTNLYDAQFREYGIQGRWPSPDPAGTAAVDPANPQSWNRYAYVLNNPLAFTDGRGLAPCMMVESVTPINCAKGGDSGSGYTVDGQPVDDGMAQMLLTAGFGVQCPNNICSGNTLNDGYAQFLAYADGTSGYAQLIAPLNIAEIELNYIRQMQQMLAAILGIDPSYLSSLGIHGGNADFAVSEVEGTNYISSDSTCEAGDFGTRCSDLNLHFTQEYDQNGIPFYSLHMDSADPYTGLAGAFWHGLVDVLGGYTIFATGVPH